MSSRPPDGTIQFRIPADPRYVVTIRRAIATIARSLGFPEDISEDIELSVAEAVSNSVEHGSPERNGNAVSVVCRIGDDNLTIDVRDEGPGFELPCTGDCDILNERGRGLRLIYRLMDKVKVSRTVKGTRLRMVKKMDCAATRESITSHG